MMTTYDLSLARSEALTKYLSDRLVQEKNQYPHGLPFSQFMEAALYHPTLGYYNAESFSLGEEGDFTTASEITPLFAQCFAKPCLQVFAATGSANILELGAGSGRFAIHLLSYLAELNQLPDHYYIYEISPSLRKKQAALLQQHLPHLLTKVIWLEKLPVDFKGIIIANEVLDALPVDCFMVTEQGIQERCVSIDNHQFVWHLNPTPSAALAQAASYLQTHYQLPNHYQSELNLQIPAFIKAITQSLQQGILLFSDYGYGEQEYYHPERQEGTLTCFYQHCRHRNPLILPGLQDITAHVNFTQVIETATQMGCELAGFTNQSSFLLDCGLMTLATMAETKLSTAGKFNLHQALKTLTLPTEMGDCIKVMGLSKNINLPLVGFNFYDRSRDL